MSLPRPTPRYDQPDGPEWRPVPDHVLEKMADLIAPVFAPTTPRIGPALRVTMRPVPFAAEGTRLFAFRQMDTMPPVTRFAMIRRATVIPMDGTAAPFDALAQAGLLVLDESNAAEYATCVLDFLWSSSGRFRIVQDLSDLPQTMVMDADERAQIADHLVPVIGPKDDGNGGYMLKGVVQNEDALFAVIFRITPDGKLALTDEKFLLDEVPIEEYDSRL